MADFVPPATTKLRIAVPSVIAMIGTTEDAYVFVDGFWLRRVKQDTSRCDSTTNPKLIHFFLSIASNAKIPQNVFNSIIQRHMTADIMKKSFGVSSNNPTVPGPTLSAKTFTIENIPDIIPKPRPTTYDRM